VIASSSAQVQVPNQIAEKILKFTLAIPEEDLYIDEEGHGRELDVHVTIKYGLVTNDPEEIKQVVEEEYSPKSIAMTLGEVSLFTSEENGHDYEVVKIDVESKDLMIYMVGLVNYKMQIAIQTINLIVL